MNGYCNTLILHRQSFVCGNTVPIQDWAWYFYNFVLSLNSFSINEIYNQLVVLKTTEDKPPEINVIDKSIYQNT